MKIDHLVHCAWFETLWFQERHAAKTVGEMKQFVSHLPQMQQAKAALAVHTNIAELIKEHTGNFESFCACRAKRVLLFHPLRSPDCCSNVHFLFFFIFFSFSYFFFFIWFDSDDGSWRQAKAWSLLLAGTAEVNAFTQGTLQRFTQWPWIEHTTFQLRGGHYRWAIAASKYLLFDELSYHTKLPYFGCVTRWQS